MARGHPRGFRARKPVGLALWATSPIQRLVQLVRQAEEIGLDSIWVIDSQLICREIFTTMAALAAGTRRIRLATGVIQPRTRHVSVAASALATLNELSEGRIAAGFGTGFSSLRTIGMRGAKLAELETYIASVRSLLNAEAVRFAPDVEGRLVWLDKPAAIPIYTAASGPKATRLAGRIADGAILLQGVAPELLSRAITWLDDGAAEAGRRRDDLDVACWIPFGLAGDAAAAREQVRVRVAGALMQTDPAWFEGSEREAVLQVQRQYQDFAHASASAGHATRLPDALMDRYAVAGTPAEVVEKLRRVVGYPVIDQVILTPQASEGPDLQIDDLLRNLDRFVLDRI